MEGRYTFEVANHSTYNIVGYVVANATGKRVVQVFKEVFYVLDKDQPISDDLISFINKSREVLKDS